MLSADDASARQEGYERHSRGESIDDISVKVSIIAIAASHAVAIVYSHKYLIKQYGFPPTMLLRLGGTVSAEKSSHLSIYIKLNSCLSVRLQHL